MNESNLDHGVNKLVDSLANELKKSGIGRKELLSDYKKDDDNMVKKEKNIEEKLLCAIEDVFVNEFMRTEYDIESVEKQHMSAKGRIESRNYYVIDFNTVVLISPITISVNSGDRLISVVRRMVFGCIKNLDDSCVVDVREILLSTDKCMHDINLSDILYHILLNSGNKDINMDDTSLPIDKLFQMGKEEFIDLIECIRKHDRIG